MIVLYQSPLYSKEFAPGHSHELVELITKSEIYSVVRIPKTKGKGVLVRTKYLIL